jgi:hypothetical protein
MKQSDKQKRLADIQALQDIQNFEANLNRARSVTVGTAFGGTTEVSLRGNDGKTLWCLLQPVEVIELIHQLAANVGCHINLQPRRDFSSWRDWRVTEEEKLHLAGHPPFSNDMAPHMQVGANLPPPEQQPGMKFTAKEQQNVVATEKTVNRRSTKRAAKAP